MAEPGHTPVWVLTACDGSGCRELLAMDDVRRRRHAVRRLALMAKMLRERGFLGVLVLTEVGTGRVVAARRVWP